MKKKIIFISIISFLIDRLIKFIVVKNIGLYSKVTIIKNFLSITYVKNDGAAWSILKGNRLFLIVFSIIAIIYILRIAFKEKKYSICYSIVIGGILGNLYDRIATGFVIDYIDFNIFGYDFPVFNVADMMIVIGIFLIVILTYRGDKSGNNS